MMLRNLIRDKGDSGKLLQSFQDLDNKKEICVV